MLLLVFGMLIEGFDSWGRGLVGQLFVCAGHKCLLMFSWGPWAALRLWRGRFFNPVTEPVTPTHRHLPSSYLEVWDMDIMLVRAIGHVQCSSVVHAALTLHPSHAVQACMFHLLALTGYWCRTGTAVVFTSLHSPSPHTARAPLTNDPSINPCVCASLLPWAAWWRSSPSSASPWRAWAPSSCAPGAAVATASAPEWAPSCFESSGCLYVPATFTATPRAKWRVNVVSPPAPRSCLD
jgi:hypothetical protein